jgi:hypothetical protein
MGPYPPEIPAICGNIFFGFSLLVAALLLFKKTLGSNITAVLLILLSLFPRLFIYLNVGGPDPASVAFFAFGALLLINQFFNSGKQSRPAFFCGGLLFGCAALFRYHVLVGGVSLLLCFTLIYWKSWRLLLVSLSGLCIAYSPQLVVNYITGHGPLETQFGLMNVYDLMYKISWYQTITLQLPHSVQELIAQNPLLFIRNYLLAFAAFWPVYLPPIVSLFIIKDSIKRKICLVAALWTMGYCLFFSATTSGRSILLPLVISFLTLGFSLQAIEELMRKKIEEKILQRIGLYAALLAIIAFAAKDIRNESIRYSEYTVCRSVERYLRTQSCFSVHQIFSTDFDLYFRSMPPFFPFFNGGAPRWGTYLFNREYPEFPVNTVKNFITACRDRGVTFVLLTPRCNLLSPELYEVFCGATRFKEMVFLKEIGRFRIFKIGKT